MTSKPDGFVYLASPYTHPSPIVREHRALRVMQVCATLLNEGIIVYSPIVHWHEIAKIFEMPKAHDFWLMADSVMITSSREVVVLMADGWEQSRGVQREIRFAKEIDKPVTYMQDFE